ncbi:MAG TPA: HD domain-containing protein, partial [Candidatus Polarisedimenticolaceae bacterium]|nr:HD domain-containing protein [Candidatus Polarisedimenticolaceae bacterium]
EVDVREAVREGLEDPDVVEQLLPFKDEHSPEYNQEVYDHSKGVAEIASTMARVYKTDLGLDHTDIQSVEMAALLHDIGKRREDIAALVKLPDKLTKSQKAIVAEHSEYSASLIEYRFRNQPMVVALVRLHHQIQADPACTPEEQENILFDLGIIGESRKKFDVLQELFEASDKLDAITRPRPYHTEEQIRKQTPSDVAAALFAHFAEGGRDPETGMDMVHKVLELKYPNRRLVWRHTDPGDVASEDYTDPRGQEVDDTDKEID